MTTHRLLCLIVCLLAPAVSARADPGMQPAPNTPRALVVDSTSAAPAPAPPRHPPAGSVVGMRGGDHDTYGRVVFDLPAGASAETSEQDGALLVRVTGATLGRAARAPRNVRAIDIDGTEARLLAAPGTTWRVARAAGQLVIDALDAPAKVAGDADPPPMQAPPPPPPRTKGFRGSPPPPRHYAKQTAAPAAPTAPPSPAPAPPAPPGPTAAAPSNGPTTAAPVTEVTRAPLSPDAAPPPATDPPATPPSPAADIGGPDSAAPAAAPASPPSMPATPPPGGPMAIAAAAAGPSVVLPFAAGTGAAAFRRGQETVVVFDERRPLDLGSLADDPGFATARVQLLPAATELSMTLPAGTTLRLTHGHANWTLIQVPVEQAPPLQPFAVDIADGQVRLAAAAPGAVVSVPDPETGGALLVGTQIQPGQGAVVTRRTPAFTLLASLQGVVVAPVSDAVSLHVATKPLGPGFLLTAESGRALSIDPPDEGALAAAAAAQLTRRWDFPNLPLAALSRRLESAMQEVSNEPSPSRGPRRLAAVQAQLALGLDAEAGALATLAATDDPRIAILPDPAALAAVGALLADLPEAADAIEDPRITGTDEVALWRAVRRAELAQRDGERPAPEAAAVFAATLPLVLAYPAPLRDRLLPLALETMVRGGEAEAARRVLDTRKTDQSLDMARAMLDDADGHIAPALATLDRLTREGDRKQRARAGVRAAELRLRAGMATPAQTADTLDQLIYAWRGDQRDLSLRLRVADLRTAMGNWRAALALLRDTTQISAEEWPDQYPMVHARMRDIFAQAMARDARVALPPLELVALIEENPDLLPDGEAGRALAARLADRLAALDLPTRALPVLAKLMAATPPGAAQAELGARLATMKLGQGDPHGALMALSASAAPDLPPPLTEQRAITFARATAAQGALAPAVATLAGIDTAAADDARASLLESAKDWPAAVGALSSLVARDVPPSGPLADAQARLVLRLATAAAQAGDEAVLARLRADDLPRMPAGKLTEMLGLLTETPVQAVSDLPRAAQEAAAARALPAALSAMAAPAVTR